MDGDMTTANVRVIVHPDREALMAAAAARLITVLLDRQSAGQRTTIALTGGGVGIGTLQAVQATPAHHAVDWSQVELFFGDERFVPAGHADRNAAQAATALLDHIPIPAGQVHRMPAADAGLSLADAADAYETVIAQHSPLDLTLLGMGPDGHVASIFPQHNDNDDARRVVPVTESPKPPPNRLSLTLAEINRSRRVWFLVGGAAKASAVATVMTGVPDQDIPAAQVGGQQETLWLVDRAAVSQTRLVGP